MKRTGAILAIALALLLLSAGVASAKDRIYFSNAGPLALANLDGTGGKYVEFEYSGANAGIGVGGGFISGLTLDPAADRFYTTAPLGGAISRDGEILSGALSDLEDGEAAVAPLATGGATVEQPTTATVDPGAGRIYWANLSGAAISWANLDGSGGGDLNTAGATVNQPFGVALDRGAGRLYWGNYGADSISYANLDGSGGGELDTSGATVDGPTGVAIDEATNRIYWANVLYFGSGQFDGIPGKISYASLDGGGGDDLDTSGASVLGVRGIALDPAENRIYWANAPAGTIAFANLDGTGAGGELGISGFPGGLFPVFPALLKQPSGTEAPEVSTGSSASAAAAGTRTGAVGRTMSCSEGQWAGDLLGGFHYRAPRSFEYQWRRNGSTIPGATDDMLTPQRPGFYRCRVRASNVAGFSSQRSSRFEVISKAACKKAKKRLKRAKKKLRKARAAEKSSQIKRAKKRVKKAKRAKRRAC